MKRLFAIITAVLLIGAFSANAGTSDRKKDQKIQEVTFVTTIDCKNCVKKLEAKLPDEKGIKDMKVTLSDKTVWIKYDSSKTSKEKIAGAIRKLGFEATEKTAE